MNELETPSLGDKVHVQWTGEDKRPPYAAAYTVVEDADAEGFVKIMGPLTDSVFRHPLRSLVLATPDPKGYVPGPRWAGFMFRLRDPQGHAASWRAYQDSARRLTPTEIEKAKQAGLQPFFDKAGL